MRLRSIKTDKGSVAKKSMLCSNMSIGHSSRFFEDGCLVKLSADFASHADAVGGPLKPGDIGTVLKAAGWWKVSCYV